MGWLDRILDTIWGGNALTTFGNNTLSQDIREQQNIINSQGSNLSTQNRMFVNEAKRFEAKALTFNKSTQDFAVVYNESVGKVNAFNAQHLFGPGGTYLPPIEKTIVPDDLDIDPNIVNVTNISNYGGFGAGVGAGSGEPEDPIAVTQLPPVTNNYYTETPNSSGGAGGFGDFMPMMMMMMMMMSNFQGKQNVARGSDYPPGYY